ncbi:MAG: hypothetical protein A4E19_13200 [Nitrospira sp. SG-bin1]|nr:MAG: hypothetical protein A4E19_13200 [Nitrospira sp. SG-bin1]
MTSHSMRLLGTVIAFSFPLALVGCDYWPPALQAEIEQLRSDIQTLTIEKAQLQAQVIDLTRAKLDVQGQIDELTRLNREKTGMITSLQNQLDTARARALKAMGSNASPHKTKTKPTVKTAGKPSAKSGARASVPKAVGVR